MEHETRGKNGTIEDHFRAAFECGFPGSKKTFLSSGTAGSVQIVSLSISIMMLAAQRMNCGRTVGT